MDGVCSMCGGVEKCSNWFIAHRQEHGFRVSENRVLF